MNNFPRRKNWFYFLILIATVVACSPYTSAPADGIEGDNTPQKPANSDTSDLIPNGWRETVISVTDVEELKRFYQDILGWEIRSEGTTSKALLNAWNLPGEATARFAVMANPGSDRGFVRIVQFDAVEQVRVRDHPQAWEVGGIYNMNVRVPDIASIAPRVTDAGWQAPSAPVNFIFGPFDVWEWIPRHKDGVRIAFAERVQPPLEGWPNLKTSSRAFNSTQIVADMDAAVEFYQGILGFKTYLDHEGASAKAQDHVLGLSHQAMTSVIRKVKIVSPSGKNDGSVELLSFENYSGRDFSSRATPPNLGNLMLRYAIPSIDQLITHLNKSGVELEYEPIEVTLPPYGLVTLLAIRAPDGAWLEFFEISTKR